MLMHYKEEYCHGCVTKTTTCHADLDCLENVDKESTLDEGAFTPHHGLEGLHVCTNKKIW